MSFNGSGTFVINSTGQPVAPNTVISSTAFNALTADLATGLSTCLTKDGQTTPTANIPLGGFKITGLGVATTSGDALSYGQAANVSTLTVGAITGVLKAAAGLVSAATAGTDYQSPTGVVNTPASTTGTAGLKVPSGVAPTAPVNGDIWSTTTGGLFYRDNGVTRSVQLGAVLHVRNQTNSGVNNTESFLGNGTWQQRVLNTVVTNTITGASLASNQITLPAGTYKVNMAQAAIYQQGGSNMTLQHRLRNVTDSTTPLASGQSFTSVSGAAQTAILLGQFTLAAAKVLELDLYANGSGPPVPNFGPGQAGGEVIAWTDLYIEKVA